MARFDEIEIFATVVEAGTITGAAGKLRLSKSRVSEAVMALETRLGARLLDRPTRRVSPTEAGQIFYARCRRALDEAQAGVTARSAARRSIVAVAVDQALTQSDTKGSAGGKAPAADRFRLRWPKLININMNEAGVFGYCYFAVDDKKDGP